MKERKVTKQTSITKTIRLPKKLIASDKRGSWSIWQDDDEYTIEVINGLRGKPLRNPIILKVKAVWTEADIHLVKHIIHSLVEESTTKLLPFSLTNETIWKVARYLKRSYSGSSGSLSGYMYGLKKFFDWIHQTPDEVYFSLLDEELAPNYRRVKDLKAKVEDYVDTLQARGQANLTIHRNYACIKTWLKVNDLPRIHVDLPPKIVIHHDRAPTPEELSRWMEFADLRGKTAISLMALGGFRIKTLSKLRYHHVKLDLERGITPIHVHVEEKITKGQYGDFSTFLGKEAVDFLKAYLGYRRRGSLCGKISPEEINDDSPLLRSFTRKVKPMSNNQIKQLITRALLNSGLVKKGPKRRELRAYSLRKYFHTNLASAGVHRDYIDHFMGHVTPTYNSIKSKGVEFLRRIYISSGLSIRPKTQVKKMDILKEMVKSLGLDPDQILVKESFTQPHRTVVDNEDVLRRVLREVLTKSV